MGNCASSQGQLHPRRRTKQQRKMIEKNSPKEFRELNTKTIKIHEQESQTKFIESSNEPDLRSSGNINESLKKKGSQIKQENDEVYPEQLKIEPLGKKSSIVEKKQYICGLTVIAETPYMLESLSNTPVGDSSLMVKRRLSSYFKENIDNQNLQNQQKKNQQEQMSYEDPSCSFKPSNQFDWIQLGVFIPDQSITQSSL